MKSFVTGLAVALLMSLSAQAQNWAPLEPPIEVETRWEQNEIIIRFSWGVRPKQIEVNGDILGVTFWERVARRKKILLPKKTAFVSLLVVWEEDGTRRTYRVLIFKPTPGY